MEADKERTMSRGPPREHGPSPLEYADVAREGRAAIVIDDVLPPWRPRGIEVRGRAEVLASGGEAFGRGWAAEIIRIWPNKVRV